MYVAHLGRLLDTIRSALRRGGATKELEQMQPLDDPVVAMSAEHFMEQTLAGAEVDLDDPDFAPVDGVDVDSYAEICRSVVEAGGQQDEAAFNRKIAEHGIDPARWKPIADAWDERVMRSEKVKLRYSRIFLGQT